MELNKYEQTLPSFDDLMQLAQQNPAAFEQFREQMCEEMIISASSNMQPRLRAQQSHINRVIRRCKNPNHINVKLMEELSLQFGRFLDAIHNEPKNRACAQILPFPMHGSSISRNIG